MEETKELEMRQSSPAALIQAAIGSNADLDKLEKLMVLQERWEANEAKKAYVSAMAAFKANPPEIDKDKTVSYGTTRYNHASLANVTTKINAALARHGLSAAWTTKQEGAGITVTCTITHSLGHSESTSLTAEADSSGQKNKIQAVGSTITYLERYTILALTGLATHDQDDDGGKSETISELQENELDALIDSHGFDAKYRERLYKYLKVSGLSEISATDFQKAKDAIMQAVKKAGK